MPSDETKDLLTNCFLERNDPREVLISLNNNLIKDLKGRATQNMAKRKVELEKKKVELNISKDLESITNFTLTDLIKLGENNINTIEDLANLAR